MIYVNTVMPSVCCSHVKMLLTVIVQFWVFAVLFDEWLVHVTLSGFSIHKYSHAVWHWFLVQSCLFTRVQYVCDALLYLRCENSRIKPIFASAPLSFIFLFFFYPIYFSSFSFLTDSSVKLILTGSLLQWPPFWTLTEFSLYSHYNLILLIPKYVRLNS